MAVYEPMYDEVGWPEDFLTHYESDSESNEDPFDMAPLRCTASGPAHSKVHYLEVTLEEILKGCTKQVTISSKDKLASGRTFDIVVKAGSPNGEEYRIQQADGSEDIIVRLRELPHNVFLRKGADIEVTTLLPDDSLASSTFELLIPTLYGDYISLKCKANCLTPNYIHDIVGYGLPYFEEPEFFGNLLVRFIESPNQAKREEQQEDQPSKDTVNVKLSQKPDLAFIEKQLKKYIKSKINPENSFEDESLLPQASPIFRQLPVSLVEVLNGCIKSIDFKRNIFNVGMISTREIAQLDVNIEPGAKAGKEYCFEEYGDKIPGQRPANILLTLVDEPNCAFKRIGDIDIEHTVTINYRQSIQMEGIIELKIPTLEGDFVSLPINERITPLTVMEIPNRGLPTLGNLKKRGNLRVKFNINKLPDIVPVLPQDLPFKQRIKASSEEKLEATQVKAPQKFLNDEKVKQVPLNLPDEVKPRAISSEKQRFSKMVHKSKLTRFSLLQQNEPILHTLPLTFNELFTGCQKEVHFKVKHVEKNGIEVEKSKQLSVTIKRGMMTGTRIVFPREGHQLKGSTVAGDLIVITGESPDTDFTREGANLFYKAKISLEDALDSAYQLTVPSIDSKPNPKLRFKKDEPIQCIYGRGLPYLNEGKLRGNIIVHWDLICTQASNLPSPSLGTLPSISAPTIEIPLVVSLREVLNGCSKRMEKVTYKVPQQKRLEAKIFEIFIYPGTETGERFIFPQIPDKGAPHYSVVFIATDEVNETFKRIDGVNLQYRQTVITSVGETINVPTLDAKNLLAHTLATIKVTKEMMALKECRLPGAGLPYPKKVNMRGRGHLIVKLESASFTIDKAVSVHSASESKSNFGSAPFGNVENLFLPLEMLVNGGKVKLNGPLGQFNASIKAPVQLGQILAFPRGQAAFCVRAAIHPLFHLQMFDLIYKVEIPLKSALCGFKLSIPTLDNEKICLTDEGDIVHPGTKKVIPNRGLYTGNQLLPTERGNLIVQFKIQYPVKLSPEVRNSLRTTFANNQCYPSSEKILNQLLPQEAYENSSAVLKVKKLENVSLKEAIIQIHLPLTYEEMVNGCRKMMLIEKQSKNSTDLAEFVMREVSVPPYLLPGDRLKRENLKYLKSQFELIIEEVPHRYFRRVNHKNGDIEGTVFLSLFDALVGYNLAESNVKLLDREGSVVFIGGNRKPVNSSRFTRSVEGKGLPGKSCKWKRGNLILHCEILFPETLTEQQKKYLTKNLPNLVKKTTVIN